MDISSSYLEYSAISSQHCSLTPSDMKVTILGIRNSLPLTYACPRSLSLRPELFLRPRASQSYQSFRATTRGVFSPSSGLRSHNFESHDAQYIARLQIQRRRTTYESRPPHRSPARSAEKKRLRARSGSGEGDSCGAEKQLRGKPRQSSGSGANTAGRVWKAACVDAVQV